MAKAKCRYPRKLRLKLEKIRAKHEEAEEDRLYQQPLLYDFLGKGSVELMHAKINNENQDSRYWKMDIKHTLTAEKTAAKPRAPKSIVLLAPWLEE